MSSVKKNLLSCLFVLDVFCSYRRYEKLGIMNRCLDCKHFKQFLRDMQEEEEEFWEEVDKTHKYGYPRRF